MTTFRAKLCAGAPQFGFAVTYPSPGVLERIGTDWDWIWIDGQHGELGYTEILHLVRACDLIGRPAIVRVPGHSAGPIGQALDTGAAGVIVPCVDTPQQARAVVDAAKFPPLGKRSYGGRRAIDRGGRTYSDTANDDTLLIVQIETPEAIDNVDAIAAVPGVDALLLGPDDLLLRRGLSMNAPRCKENLGTALECVLGACRKHGKLAVMVGVGSPMLQVGVQMGFEMVVAGADVPFLVNSSKHASAEARAAAQAAKRS